MFVGQLIYTACGKDRKGGYSVWSCSADITAAESECIEKIMEYSKPYDRYSDTEDINAYPKKISYFILPGGRYCIAQSAYVGAVYSDYDCRRGNYIIHAYVADSLKGVSPLSYVGSGVFKTFLTYEEWHENEAPEYLPAAELDENIIPLTQKDAEMFFSDERCRELELLLQAVINTYDSETDIIFSDTYENEAYWYKAISLLIPCCMQEKLTFESMSKPVYGNGNNLCYRPVFKLRNIPPETGSSYFSYDDEIRNNRYAFDFKNKKINTNISISSYVKNIVGLMKNSFSAAVLTVKKIDRLMTAYGLRIEQAYEIFNLISGNFRWFSDISQLRNTISMTAELCPGETVKVADGLYSYYVTGNTAQCSKEILPVYRFVYSNSSAADKSYMIEKYIYEHSLFGINDSRSPESFVKEIISSAPFSRDDFVKYIMTDGNMDKYCEKNSGVFNMEYLLFVSLIDELKKKDDKNKNDICRFLLYMMINALKESSSEHYSLIIREISPLGKAWEEWIVKNSIKSLKAGGSELTKICDIDFLLDPVLKLSSDDLSLMLLGQLIEENAYNRQFAEKYTVIASYNKNKFDYLEMILSKDEKFSVFFDNLNILRFYRKKDITISDLQDFYTKFYFKNKANVIFYEKVISYINSCPPVRRINECCSAYANWFRPLPEKNKDVMDCISNLCSIIFDTDLKTLEYNISNPDIKEMVGLLCSANYVLPDNYYVFYVHNNIKNFLSKRKPAEEVRNELYTGNFYRYLASAAAVDSFVVNFMADVVKMYLVLSAEDTSEADIEICFGYISGSPHFNSMLLRCMDIPDNRLKDRFISDMFLYAYGKKTPLALKFRDIIAVYIEKLSHSERKRLFYKLSQFIEMRPSCSKNAKEALAGYQKKYGSFMNRFFSHN